MTNMQLKKTAHAECLEYYIMHIQHYLFIFYLSELSAVSGVIRNIERNCIQCAVFQIDYSIRIDDLGF